MKIVFLHWLWQNSQSWEKVISHLDFECEVFSPNLFEFCVENEKNFDKMYEWLEKFLQKFDEKIILCGLSLGWILALKYAINHSEKIEKMLIIGSRISFPKILMKIQNFIMKILPEKNFTKIWISKRDFLKFLQSIDDLDFSEKLSQISCWVWVFCGEKDFFNKKESLKIFQKIPNSKMFFIEKTGHQANLENPKLLAEKIKNFLF